MVGKLKIAKPKDDLSFSNGFEFKNKVYKSLSAIANEVTGKHWNGRKFFGVV
jgi:hypothetical protein